MKDEEITSEHTSAYIAQVLEDIELLRMEMGRNRDIRVPMHIRDASPREVFYHAQTVHRKADQLCVELGGHSIDPPVAAAPARAQPADVFRVLESTRQRLSDSRVLLGLDPSLLRRPTAAPLRRAAGRDASDVLDGCLSASRQLNVMLALAFTSAEAHERLVRALGTAERLLGVVGVQLPAAPSLERRKFPREVFEVLWQTCDVLHDILRSSGLAALELRRGFVAEEPGDVFDIASLIVSELEYVATFIPVEPASLDVPTPKRTLPAHNYQRARQLLTAMQELARAVEAKPSWLPNASAATS
ncbi:MAG: hypothetical protein NT062_34730 [Proteobacteria bacterium]|nr:hypothetical protein [Pseudomonadota bacterium]